MEQVTIKDIAKMCGVGVSTVSRAINNHPDINQETKTKIMEAIRKYNYVPNNSAQNLKRSESQTIAILVKGISNPFFGEMIQIFEEEVSRMQYSFVLHQVEEEDDELEAAIRLEKEKRLKGVIFLGGLLCHTKDQLSRLTVPFVNATVDMHLPEGIDYGACVSIDDEKESYRIVDELCRRGHRKIAILTAPENDQSIGMRRLAGYRRALEENGSVYDPELVVYMSRSVPAYSAMNGYEQTKKLLRSGADFSCIFAIADTMAIGACRALYEAGKKIPEDCSVAGFDGLDMVKFYCPSIMTVGQPRKEIAREAVRMLFDLINGRDVDRRKIFDAQILDGESVRRIK